MKVWHCEYYWFGAFGASETYHTIVVAETEHRALTLAQEDKRREQGTLGVDPPKGWEVTEIPTDKEGARFISARG